MPVLKLGTSQPALARAPSAWVGGSALRARGSPFWLCAFLFFRPPPAGMDTEWLVRLTDERPGLSFLSEYGRALRLVSGLCNLGCIRARRHAMNGRLDDQFRTHTLADPQVRTFLGFLGEFSASELPMVFEVLRQHLFPDAPSGCLFRAASVDPRTHPFESLRAAVTDLREFEQMIGPLPELDRWKQTPTHEERSVDVESLLATTIALPKPSCLLLPSALSGVFGPASFSAPICDPEVERVQVPVLHKLATYVFFRGQYIATKIAEIRRGSTGEELLEAVWPSVLAEAKKTGDQFHYGTIRLPGKNVRLWMKDPLAEVLQGTEAVVEISFSDNFHTNSAAFHVEIGKVPLRSTHDTEDVPQVPSKYRHVRPTTPDRKRKDKPADSAHTEKVKRKRRSRWDEPTEPAGSTKEASASSTTRFVLAFSPPPGLPKIPTQLIRLLNSIQSQFPVSLDTVNFVLLNGEEDPSFFGGVTDFGNLLSRFCRESKLSLLSYDRHWSLILEDIECVDRTANVFLKVHRNSTEEVVKPIQAPEQNDGDDKGSKRGEGRRRSPAAGSQPEPKRSRPVFRASGDDKSSGGNKKGFSLDCSGGQNGHLFESGQVHGPRHSSVVPLVDFENGLAGTPYLPFQASRQDLALSETTVCPAVDPVFADPCVPVCGPGVLSPSGGVSSVDFLPFGCGPVLGSGCGTLEPLESLPEPCLPLSAGAVVAASAPFGDTAPRRSEETFACLQQIHVDGEVQWKSWVAPLNGDEDIRQALWDGPTTDAVNIGENMVTTAEGCESSGTFRNVLDCNMTLIDTQSNAGEASSQYTGKTVPLAQQCPSPITASCPVDSQQVEADEREGAQPTISPTQAWTQPCFEEEMPPYSWPKSILLPAEDGLSDSDLLAAFRDYPLAELGADLGVTLVYRSQRARLQIMQAPASQLVSARAYMVQGDCCPTCFCEGRGWECSNCFSPMTQFRLPSHSGFTFPIVLMNTFTGIVPIHCRHSSSQDPSPFTSE